MTAPQPSRGESWSINFDLVVVLPITSKDKKQPIHVSVKPPEGGLGL